MKCQELFSKNNKKIDLKVLSAAVVIGALRVKSLPNTLKSPYIDSL